MAYIDCYNASQDATLNQRVRVAMMLAAQAIATTTTSTMAETALIAKVMGAVDEFANLFTVCVTANGITLTSTDAEILTAVQDAWTTFAAVI
jgi:hypothetical protein